jgi:hypothetical protein
MKHALGISLALVAFATGANAQASSGPVKVSFEDPFAPMSPDIVVTSLRGRYQLKDPDEYKPDPPRYVTSVSKEVELGGSKRLIYEMPVFTFMGIGGSFYSEEKDIGPGSAGYGRYEQPKASAKFAIKF